MSIDVPVSDDTSNGDDQGQDDGNSEYDEYQGNGWCGGGIDYELGYTYSALECWGACASKFNSTLVAIDWAADFGECYCQDACECMEDVGDDNITLIVTKGFSLPNECNATISCYDDCNYDCSMWLAGECGQSCDEESSSWLDSLCTDGDGGGSFVLTSCTHCTVLLRHSHSCVRRR